MTSLLPATATSTNVSFLRGWSGNLTTVYPKLLMAFNIGFFNSFIWMKTLWDNSANMRASVVSSTGVKANVFRARYGIKINILNKLIHCVQTCRYSTRLVT